jgi:hypothetical protein
LKISAPTVDSLQQDLIREKDAGILVEDINGLESALVKLALEFKAQGYINSAAITPEDLSRKGQVQKLAALIHQIADKKN